MQNKIITSRSVVVNPIFKKNVEQNYEKHMQRLNEIKTRKFSKQSGEPSELVTRKLSVKNSIAKVQQEFDPHLNEKKSLINHIRTILTRKGDSFQEIKRYKNKFLENEKKEIERQNKLLYEKIGEGQQNRLTKKQLKQQFAAYESHKSLLRKVKYESQKPLKKKQKSVDASHEMKHPD